MKESEALFCKKRSLGHKLELDKLCGIYLKKDLRSN